MVVVLTLAVLVTGCGRTSSVRSSGSPVVGLLYPTSGSQALGGTQEARGARLAIDWANDHGGLRGRQLAVETADVDRPESVPAAMASLKAKGVTVVIGSHGSAVSAAAAQDATRQGMILWETGAVGEVPPEVASGRNFFRLAPMGANLGGAAIDFVRDELATKLPTAASPSAPLRYAVAYIDDAYGRAVGMGAADRIERSGQTSVGTFPYAPDTTDFAPLVARLAQARPDVLFVAAYIDDGVALRQATVAAHLPLKASIGTSSSYCQPVFGDRLGDDAVGLFASDKPDAADVRPEALNPEGRAALEWVKPLYQDLYHEPMTSPALSGFSNAYAVVVHVLPAARSLRPADLADAASTVTLPEGSLANGGGFALGPAGAPDAGENRNAAGVIWEWTAPGTRAVVWPPAYATSPVVALPISR
jgi:branched-chain amino acid transport system substrate-binding protein